MQKLTPSPYKRLPTALKLAAQNIHHASANGLKGRQQLGFSNNKQRKSSLIFSVLSGSRVMGWAPFLRH
jgi:hypothetical protein